MNMNDFITQCRVVVGSITEFFPVKLLLSAITTIGAYLVGDSHLALVGSLTVLVIIDAITGIAAAYKLGKPIESRVAVRTPIKWTMYILMIAGAHLAESILPFQWYLTTITVAFLGITEFISILENVGNVGYAIPKKLLNKLETYRDGQ